jgi:cell division transport system ATP-binding protein
MISLENVSKKFGTGVFAISDITFSIEKGEFVFLIGPTGSGKTTIFRLLIREMLPTQGSVVVNSWDIVKLPNKKVPELRKKIGVIFQDLKLLADRTILENTTLPLEVVGVNKKDAINQAMEILNQVGILEHKDKFPIQLSGGELQRAAIARALILSPDILLADEPTGNLDDDTAWEIVKLLSDINEKGTTVVMATHNSEIIKKLNKRTIELNKGTMVHDKNDHKAKSKEHDKDDHRHHESEKKEHEENVAPVQDSEPKEVKADDFEEALK